MTPAELSSDISHVCDPSTQVVQWVKNPPAMQETLVRSLGQEDPLEKGKATHSSILGWDRDCGVKENRMKELKVTAEME